MLENTIFAGYYNHASDLFFRHDERLFQGGTHLTSNITKKQHYVPAFYLRAWRVHGKEFAHFYDLETTKILSNKPETMFAENYFYEQNSRFPENYVEAILSEMESKTAPIFIKLDEILGRYPNYSQENSLRAELNRFMTIENRAHIKEFAAYQYLRTPGAMEQKYRELAPDSASKDQLVEQLKPANFVITGYDFLRERFFKKMGMALSYSFDYQYLTSDWPGFDFREGNFAPIMGVEIGAQRDVLMILPITPRALLTLFPLKYLDPRFKNTAWVLGGMSQGQVKNVNTLIIQQARRWIVSNKQVDYIWKIASKRKKVPVRK